MSTRANRVEGSKRLSVQCEPALTEVVARIVEETGASESKVVGDLAIIGARVVEFQRRNGDQPVVMTTAEVTEPLLARPLPRGNSTVKSK